LWIKVMPKYFANSAPELALAWSKAKQAVCQGPTPTTFVQIESMKIQWRNVTGPVSNMVATLYSVGFNPVSFSEWLCPNTGRWFVPTAVGFEFCP
jgi:hypothetical protein